MKIAFVGVLYNTPQSEIDSITHEIENLDFETKIYWHDNSEDNRGFAYGVNQGMEQAMSDGYEIFAIINTDIHILHLEKKDIENGLEKFDILGGEMIQNNLHYYGGTIDKWRLSGGLNTKNPAENLAKADYITGSFLIIKKHVIDKIGLLNENYVMYYEDVELCHEAFLQGFKIGINTNIVYEHFENSQHSKLKKSYLKFNRWQFFIKYANFTQWLREIIRLPLTLLENFYDKKSNQNRN